MNKIINLRIIRSLLIISTFFISTTTFAEENRADSDRFQKVADRLVKAINKENHTAIRQDFSKSMLKTLSLPKTKTFFKSLMTKLGKIQKLDEPNLISPNRVIFPVHFEKGLLDLKFALDKNDKIIGLVFVPHTGTDDTHLAKKNKTKSDRYQEVADRLVKAINEENHTAIRQDFGKPMLNALSLPKTKTYFKSLMTNLGKIKKLDKPNLIPPNQAIFPAHFEKELLGLKIVLDQNDKIIGLFFIPHTVSNKTPIIKKHKTKLILPVKGNWFVYWGGDTKELNHHHEVIFQRYALDLVVMDEDGNTYQGDGQKNEDYYAFGKELLSPANGVVIDVLTGVRDNPPGIMNPYSTFGNAVLIKHRNNEISFFAHFKQGSIKVKVGDKVKSGQVIGLCGNSGHSSEPHIHYHLQNDTPMIQNGTGIKCRFKNLVVTRNGKKRSRKLYSPIKGDVVRNKL